MTREEAINQLQDAKDGYEEYLTEEAINMAIQALSSWEEYSDKLWKEAYERGKTEALSQEPCDDATLKDIFCMGCEYREQEPCEDAISRKKAICVISACDGKSAQIEALEQLPSVTQKSETVTEFADRCRECGAKYGKLLKQKKGHWIETEYHRWRCSVCREKGMSEWDNIHNVRTNFCPDCGAKMESEEQTDAT